MSKKKGSKYYIPVWNGLLEAKHRQQMGAAIWTYLALIDLVPKKSDKGLVLNGAVVTLNKLAELTGYSHPQIQRDITKLSGTYLDIKRVSRGFIIHIKNWRKVISRNNDITIPQVDNSSFDDDNSRCDVDNSYTSSSAGQTPNSATDNTIHYTVTKQYIDESIKKLQKWFELTHQQQFAFSQKNGEEERKRVAKCLEVLSVEEMIRIGDEIIDKHQTEGGQLIKYFTYKILPAWEKERRKQTEEAREELTLQIGLLDTRIRTYQYDNDEELEQLKQRKKELKAKRDAI